MYLLLQMQITKDTGACQCSLDSATVLHTHLTFLRKSIQFTMTVGELRIKPSKIHTVHESNNESCLLWHKQPMFQNLYWTTMLFFFLSILLSNLGVIEDVQTFHVPHLCNNKTWFFKSFFLNLTLIKSASIVGHTSAYSCNSFANVGGKRNFTATEDIKFFIKS